MSKIDLVRDKEAIYEYEKNLNLSLENLSFIFSQYFYRDTIIEDYHAESVACDSKLYKKIYNTVTRKYKNLFNMKYILDLLQSEHPLYNLIYYVESGKVKASKEIKSYSRNYILFRLEK